MDDMLRRTLGESIDIEAVYAEGLWPCYTDSAQAENCLINLCINARDAMPEGGKITIVTDNIQLDEEYAATRTDVVAGQYVMFAVSDTGKGILDEILTHVFEPFFTTKEEGKGTGLGLSMIYGFAKQSGGHADIYSEKGEGTTVRLYLPRYTGIDETNEAEVNMGDSPKGQQSTVLVVEDESDLLKVIIAQLESLDYIVLSAKDGATALKVAEQNKDIDLLLTDLNLTGELNGCDIADFLLQQYSTIKVLYMSGYSEAVLAHQRRPGEDIQLLEKPFSRGDLANMLSNLLD